MSRYTIERNESGVRGTEASRFGLMSTVGGKEASSSVFQDGKRSTAIASSSLHTDKASPLHVADQAQDQPDASPRQRCYYLDWLRTIAIEHVVVVHILEVCFMEGKVD